MTAVWEIQLPDSEKLVLLALADNANDEGVCWPSIATIAKKCSKGERTIQGAIKSLADAGHLTRDEKPGKGVVYTIHPRRECTPAENAPPQPLRPAAAAPTPAAAAPKPSINRQPLDADASKGRARKQATKHRLPDGWRPDKLTDGSVAGDVRDRRGQGWMRTTLATFTAHWYAEATPQASKSNWQQAWIKWVIEQDRRDGRNEGHRNGGGQGFGGSSIPGLGRTAAAALRVFGDGSSPDGEDGAGCFD